MLAESITIVMILLFMVFIFLRVHHKDYAVATIPLLLVPLVYAISSIMGEFFLFAQSNNFRAAAIVLALAASVALMGMFCTKRKTRRLKYAYLILCGSFSTLLTWIFLYEIYLPILK